MGGLLSTDPNLMQSWEARKRQERWGIIKKKDFKGFQLEHGFRSQNIFLISQLSDVSHPKGRLKREEQGKEPRASNISRSFLTLPFTLR